MTRKVDGGLVVVMVPPLAAHVHTQMQWNNGIDEQLVSW